MSRHKTDIDLVAVDPACIGAAWFGFTYRETITSTFDDGDAVVDIRHWRVFRRLTDPGPYPWRAECGCRRDDLEDIEEQSDDPGQWLDGDGVEWVAHRLFTIATVLDYSQRFDADGRRDEKIAGIHAHFAARAMLEAARKSRKVEA